MGLGSRNATKHDTAMSRHAVQSELFADFREGQRVKTIDGIHGTVAAIEDGPFPGTEAYRVTLDHGLGGGLYVTSQLTAILGGDANTSPGRRDSDPFGSLGQRMSDHRSAAVSGETSDRVRRDQGHDLSRGVDGRARTDSHRVRSTSHMREGQVHSARASGAADPRAARGAPSSSGHRETHALRSESPVRRGEHVDSRGGVPPMQALRQGSVSPRAGEEADSRRVRNVALGRSGFEDMLDTLYPTTSQLQAAGEAKTSEHHTADQDYAELGSILYERPDIAPRD